MRYVVPYSAPGIKWGQLRVDADSSAEAMVKAQEIHTRPYPSSPPRGWAGPGCRGLAGTLPRHKFTKRERSQIIYGEPVALAHAVAS